MIRTNRVARISINKKNHYKCDTRVWINKEDELIRFCVDCMIVKSLVTLDKNEVSK